MQSLAQMRSQNFGNDGSSLLANNSSRKASRLSNFNPISRSRTLPRYDDAAQSIASTNSGATTNTANVAANSLNNLTNSGAESIISNAGAGSSTNNYTTHSLGQHINSSSSSLGSGQTNYQLVKMDTNHSVSSDLSLQTQFKVSLKMSKKEIDLIRYTWNKMLLDEPVAQQSQKSFGMPGSFPNAKNDLTTVPAAGSKEKTTNYISRTSASTVASSLFCRQFYSNLLARDSNLEKLFPSIKHQAVSFAGVMSFAISQLENLNTLDDYLINLGKRHSRILGIEPANFELMGEALIQTFHERFGTRFTQELELLWIKLYMYLANSLLQFGIDPVMRLEDSGDDIFETGSISTTSQNYFWGKKSFGSNENGADTSASSLSINDDKRSSISTAATGTTNANTMISAASSAPTSVEVNLNKKLPPVVFSKDNASMMGPAVPKKASIKKRKRDCIIM